MTISGFMNHLRHLDIKVWMDGERLRFSAPKGILTQPIRNELSERKAEIITFLKKAHGVVISPIKPVPPKERDQDLPLSYAQQRLWFLNHLDPESPLYNLSIAVRLSGYLNVAALEQSLNEVIRRHEVLRSIFKTSNGKPSLHIDPHFFRPFQIVDLTRITGSDLEEVESRLLSKQAKEPFNLSQGPLIRMMLIRLSKHEHILNLTMHHIVSDGWSLKVFLHELALFYRSFLNGEPSPLSNLSIQYVDFAHWQKKWLKGDALDKSLEFWKQRLTGLPPLLNLPTDRPRPVSMSGRGSIKRFDLTPSLSNNIRRLSKQANVTTFMILLAAFQTLLFRYTGQDDLAVGTPNANRNRSELENLIGFFVNTLVVRTDLSGDPTFFDLLQRIYHYCIDAYTHQDVPFESIVDAVAPQRNISYSPLFQVMFSLQDDIFRGVELAGLKIHLMETDSETSKYDFSLLMTENSDHLTGRLEFNTDLFEFSTIERMIEHFECLLTAVTEHPNLRLSELPVVKEHESRQLLSIWNDTVSNFPKDRCFHNCFEFQAEKTPDQAAVFYEGRQLTYRQLNRRANQIARYLRRLGVKEETIVGLCVERSVDMIVSVLGILKAGGVYLPLDPSSPAERLVAMMEDAAATILLTQEGLLSGPRSQGVQRIYLDRDWPIISRESIESPPTRTDPINLAYIIYTSGSTGRPKGVMIPHRSILHLATALNRIVYGGSEVPLRIGFNAPLSFDASVQQLVMLLYGHTLYLIPQEVRGDGKALLQYIRRNRLDALDCVPTQLRILLKEGLLDGSSHWTPSLVLPGGEAIDEATWLELIDVPRTEFFNMYGPTECTVDTTVARIRVAGRRPVIGRPVSNSKHYILDGYLQPVPVGVVGELHIGGEAVGRGYLNRPEMTAEKFIPDLFSGEPGGRLYKTGDLVRCLPDGNIECLGRADHQVKIRGFRIELGEIEGVLSEHPDLKDATVWPWEEGGRKRLAAYVVPRRKEIPSDTADLRDFLRQRLPDYMIPSAFIFMDELPLTPNRKVDRRALPSPDEGQAEQLMKQYVAPTTTEETVLADIWAEVLGIKQVGVHDNFFELGGDSILSIQVIARANQAGLRLTPRKLFEAPTVAELAREAGKAPAIQAEQGIVEGPVPLTPIMHWFFSQDLPEPHHFNQSILFEVQEALDPLFLQRALGYLLEQHDALRLRFKQTDTGWEATNAGVDGVVPFEWIDLSKMAKEDHAREIEARAARLQTSLDLINGPLMRIAYFHLGELPDRLVIIIHHLAVDVISWRILLEDLLGAYRQLKTGESVRLPRKTTPFRDWARRLSEYALTDAVQRDLPHWRAILKRRGTPLPVDFPGGSKAESLARETFISLTPEETDFLVEKVKAVFGTEVEEVLLTALATSVSKWSGSERIVIDVEGHGREDLFEDIDISRTVGWFTALRPITLKVRKTDDMKSTLLSVKEQLRKTPNRGLTYGLLAYSRTLSNDLKWDHLSRESEIIFNYVGMIDKMLDKSLPVRFSEGSIGSLRSPQWKRRHSFVINGGIFQGSVRLKWSYSEGLYSSDSVKRLTEDFIGTLRDIIEECRSFDREIYTPSDFPELELDQSDIDALMSEIGSETFEGQPTRLA